MIDKLNAALRFNQEALALRARRQEVLAANIANADTPGYKARDVDFAGELSRVLAQGAAAGAPTLATTSARHLHAGAAVATDASLLYRVPAQSSIDGNTVEMDAERVNFADNAMRYEAGLTVVSGKIKSLLAALQQ
ncbi:flagellar basal body rod protein FlgB [Ramlibacter sp. RBP-2]|uniref:Flagellar basal body rod protein FlgB n=1 Tax=Ramlibacter lithotrophicus TaxID=2606681 RepID=A0A7X6DFQ2_9BURK|nr:flagellar basal body rod protein FlgB [Ramlibacter lithotrophicus]NKE66183.1 flagellar basal body rod protein FlgB [Ramlibacter lithotrophicus]